MSGPSVHIGLPSKTLMGIPDGLPAIRYQFTEWLQDNQASIHPALYAVTVDYRFPLISATIYLSATLYANRVNNWRNNKRWAISMTRGFRVFVFIHNALLALLSAWVFFSVCEWIRSIWPPTHEEGYPARIAENICRMHKSHDGTSPLTVTRTVLDGKGRAAEYSDDIWDEWHNRIHYIFWIFYLMKFYEIVDTAIIVANGRKSSLLHTYHHTGVMLCGWAGLRSDCPAALIAAILNSAIHTVMYVYYGLAATRVRLPTIFKMFVTSAQIIQFVIGSLAGMGYLFVNYVTVHSASDHPYMDPRLSESETLSIATKGYGAQAWDGEVRSGNPPYEEVTYELVPCLANSEQVFVLWLGVAFLMPLSYLFIRFFNHTYIRPKKTKCE